MNEHPHPDSLHEIYYQASEWIRMCNNIIWSLGTFLMPLSVGCIGIAIQFPSHQFFLAPAQLICLAVLAVVWVVILAAATL